MYQGWQMDTMSQRKALRSELPVSTILDPLLPGEETVLGRRATTGYQGEDTG